MRLLYPLLLAGLLLALVAPTAAGGFILWWWLGIPGLSVFLLVPAAAMLLRAVLRREPFPWVWMLFGALWACFVWMALPVVLGMSLGTGKSVS